MEAFSSTLLISVFLLGVLCGALLVTLQRQTRLQTLKAEFAAELQAMIEASARMTTVGVSEQVAASDTVTAGRPGKPKAEDRSERVSRAGLHSDIA